MRSTTSSVLSSNITARYTGNPQVRETVSRFFSVRIISWWNRLPASLVQVHNLIKFKSMLRTVDLFFALLGKL